MLPLSSLCIHPGKAVWVLYVDATCINYDGNTFDAALIAMVAALKNSTQPLPFHITDIKHVVGTAQLPQATFNEDSGQTLCSRKTRIPLQITRTPTSMSFGIFDSYVVGSICLF